MLTDVLVIGGGMVGCYCACQLASHGLKTVLLERGEIASGASGRGGGLLLKGATDLFVPEVVPHLKANQSLLENFIRETDSDVEYVRGGSLYVAFDSDWDVTRNEVKRLNESGIAAELWDRQELMQRLPMLTDKAVGGRFIPDDAQLTSPKLTTAFAHAARRAGADVRTGVRVGALATNPNGSIRSVTTSEGEMAAGWVVFATNAYTGHLLPEIKESIVPTRGQAFLTAAVPPAFPFACAANYDLEYWRQTRTGQILFGGCRHSESEYPHGKGTESNATTGEVQEALRQTFDSFFPRWARIALEKVWAGTMGFTPDYRPLIGPLSGRPNLLIAAGFSGNCLPLVCIAGQMIRELIIQGASSLPLGLFNPARFAKASSA
jgi:glycine/D-amino acid oxidase-like deaminating enzyme